MEWLFVLVLFAILFGPILWALTVGRRPRAPADEDAEGATAWGSFIRRVLAPPGERR